MNHMPRLRLALALTLLSSAALAGEPAPAPDASKFADYDEVVAGLLQNLYKDRAAAEDAAVKLGQLGKHSLTALIDLSEKNYAAISALQKDKDKPKDTTNADKENARRKEKEKLDQVVFYTTMALSRIRSPEAGRALLPIIKDQNAIMELRCMAMEANGLDTLDEGIALLQEVAMTDPDIRIRKKAFKKFQTLALSNKITTMEKLFVDALSDPDEEIRQMAAQECYFVPVFKGAIPKLIELAEKDPGESVRIQSMLALRRMRVRESVVMMVRVCQGDEASKSVKKAAFDSITSIANIALKDNTVLKTWWDKAGEKEYGKLEFKPLPPPVNTPKDDDTHAAPVPTPTPVPTPSKPADSEKK